MADSVFSASGLASGIDTNSIIDKLVSLESQPITNIRAKQSNIKLQISSLADIASKLNDLSTAAQDLADNGAYSAKTTSTNSTFSAVPGTGAVAGRFSVEVGQLASAAKWRSDAFASTDTLAAGTLILTVQGKQYPPADDAGGPIAIEAGDTLGDVAYKIRRSGAPVSAMVLTDSSGHSYLSLTNRDTGQPLDGGTALAVSFTAAGGATGSNLDFGTPTVTAATNARVLVDGIEFVRTSNSISDVLPGTTLNLTSVPATAGTPEDLVVATDADGTKTRLQKFVDAYNAVIKLVQRQLAVTKDTSREKTLAGDSNVRDVQTKLQRLASSVVPGLGGIRSLADLGIKTARDGTLSIDATTLGKALTTDPSAVNSLFSTATGGIGDLVKTMVNFETRAGDGLLVADQAGLNKTIDALDGQAETIQRRVDAYKKTLQAQFTAMEAIISQLKSVGSFLTSQSTSSSSSK
jgi:flagellar hook-associated protein 2